MIFEYKGNYIKKGEKKVLTLIDKFKGKEKIEKVVLRDKSRHTFSVELEDFIKNYVKV